MAVTILVIGGCKAGKKTARSGNAQEQGASSQFENYFIDACTHSNNGNYDVALKLFNKCKELKPQEASVYYEMSRLYEKENDKSLALQHAMKAWEYAPENKFYAIWYAAKLRQNSNLTEAGNVLEKALENNKKDETIVKELDYLYALKNEHQKRISLWNNYQAAAGFKLGTSLKLIDLYKSQKDYKSAHTVYDQIKKASPGKYQYFIDDANLYLEQQDEINANLNFEKAIEINPNNWKVNYALYNSYRQKKDFVKAGRFLKQAFADVNTNFDSKISACVELNNEVKADTSINYFTRIAAAELIKLYPLNANALVTAARFLDQAGHTREALDNYQKAYTLNPNMFEAWTGAINASEKLDLAGNMATVSEQALEYYPNVAALYASAAKGYNLTGEYRKALDQSVSGKSYALDDEVRYQLFLQEGIAQFRLKNYTEAEKSLKAAMAINSKEKELYDQLGNVLFFLGKKDEAVQQWQKAKELGLNTTNINKKINERTFHE
jgi:tetratricopeptide (TPR) repeat protein